MTESGRPFDGIAVGDAGPYSSANWAENWNFSFARGSGYPNAGPFLGSGTPPYNGLRVQAQSPAAAAVDVLSGSALVNGRWYLNNATKALTIAANASGNPRIDTVVVRCDYSLQTIRLAVSQGTPAGSPTPPNLTQTASIWEIPLADVAVASGFTSISNDNITPRHEWANAPLGDYEIVLNNSGGTLVTGDVVIYDTSADRAVTTTTTYNHNLVAGVIVGRISNGGYGLMLKNGIGYVQVNGAYSRGTGLSPSTTAKQAGGVSGNSSGTLGVLLEVSTGAGQLRLASINVQRRKNAIARYSQTLSSGTAGPIYSAGDNTVVLNTEDTDLNNIGVLASNQVTLQPGMYKVHGEVSVTANTIRQVRAMIYDATAAGVIITGVNVSVNNGVTGFVTVGGHILVTTPTVYELRVRFSGAGTNAPAALSSGSEVYATLEFVRIDQ